MATMLGPDGPAIVDLSQLPHAPIPAAFQAGNGNETVYGTTGADTIYGGIGIDLIYGNGGSDLLYGGIGGDTIYGGSRPG